MPAVTSVYGCRYCSWLHSREALKSGIREEEVARLVNGILHNCPESETTAVAFWRRVHVGDKEH